MSRGIFARFCKYLKERFPLQDYIPLSIVLAITGGSCVQASIYSAVKDGVSICLGFLALFLFLLRLRIFDEFKDFVHDSLYYPARPVPRGLITLPELKLFISLISCAEILLAASKGLNSLVLFCLAFAYSLLMFKEFFASRWLRQHFTIYVLLHEILVFPLFFYLFSLNGMPILYIGKIYFWILAFFLGGQLFLLEVARKIRPAELEIPSRDTYTAQYGLKWVSVMVICLGIMVICLKVLIAKSILGKILLVDYLSLLVLIILIFTVFNFIKHPNAVYAKRILYSAILFNFVTDAVLVTSLLYK